MPGALSPPTASRPAPSSRRTPRRPPPRSRGCSPSGSARAVRRSSARRAARSPGSGFVEPLPALMIGGVAGVLCYSAVNLKSTLGWFDDALDVVGVHGVGGTWGAIATGLWATAAVNPDAFAPKGPAVAQGLLVSGQWGLLGYQV